MELLNYHQPLSNISTYQPDAETQIMKKPLFTPNNIITHNQVYQYQSDCESTSVHNTSAASTNNDYDYKESYSYMLNPNEVSSIGSFSPANTPFNLTMLQSQQQRAQSQNGPSLSEPHLQPQPSQTQSLGIGLLQGNSQLPLPINYQPIHQQPDEKCQVKSHSLPELKYAAGEHEDKGRLGSYTAPIYAPHSEAHYTSYQSQQLPLQGNVANAVSLPLNIDVNQYPDMTTLVNSNSLMVVPLVESQFVDHKVCCVCGKRITRDMSRHMRTHQSESRFTCKFPKNQCRHKSGKFNRPYDFKKHLLNRHFKFDNLSIKRLHNLSDKLDHWGTCPCGLRYFGKDWLDDHILTDDASKMCPFIK